ncbi:MAG TPA: hypothetical protein PK028_05260 [Bacteroidales bacterium]|jgi:hypothetical protein|nr:hypothetical protein [Bacteroidales bacterium]MDI9573347.1 hypothetical protein [Bacteroidota bacterium]OQC59846.1 MAG: hypothetical protein BWX51_01313 [Bacteroidetes bacterium ADurb.Bin012]MBP9511891.1 hypothetical protein [Bacteroidales bacterium]MBP9588338.1 hypothetical protein [Bacteroidales bacterium]
MKYKPGDIAEFEVINKKSFPDDREYFVLQDASAMRFLLPAKRYSHYSIECGIYIKCRIDRINCNGRIFLEPFHPYLHKGSSYVFEVYSLFQSNLINIASLKDQLGYDYMVMLRPDYRPSEKILCRVKKISKAKVHLVSEVANPQWLSPPQEGLYTMKNIGIYSHPSGNRFCLAYHPIFGVDLIPLNSVVDAGFEKSPFLQCFVYTDDYEIPRFEPVPAGLWPGKEKELYFDSYDSKMDCMRGPKTIMIVNDGLGNEYEISLGNSKYITMPFGNPVKCRVKKIKKGRPVFELIP